MLLDAPIWCLLCVVYIDGCHDVELLYTVLSDDDINRSNYVIATKQCRGRVTVVSR